MRSFIIFKLFIIFIILLSCNVYAKKNPVTTQEEIPMLMDSGIYNIRINLNNKISLRALLDSGAAETSIPNDIIVFLIKTGTITDSDILDTKEYTLADGSVKSYRRVNIKQLQVGNVILFNVTGIIGDSSSSILLGQTFFKKFPSYSINNIRQVLILDH